MLNRKYEVAKTVATIPSAIMHSPTYSGVPGMRTYAPALSKSMYQPMRGPMSSAYRYHMRSPKVVRYAAGEILRGPARSARSEVTVIRDVLLVV